MRPRAVVIGAGLGGLAVALRLLAADLHVTVVERAPSVGGRAARLLDGGFTFDLGPSLLTMPELVDDVLRLAGTTAARELRLRRLDPFYRISWRDDRRSLLFGADEEAMREQLVRFSPEDAGRYAAFRDASRRIYEEAILAAGRRPFLRITDLLLMLPTMIRLDALRPVDRFVGRFFREPHLRQAFGFHPLFIGGDPFRVPAVYAALAYLQLIGGVWYPEGGMHSVVEALAGPIRREGGILSGVEATEIIHRSGRVRGVRLADREVRAADVVVSNADVQVTRRLAGLPGRRQRMTMSCFMLHLGTSCAFPSLHHHTLLVGPGYRAFIDDVTRRGRLPRDESLYVHAPSRTEPAMARPSGEAISVLLPVPNLAGAPPWPEVGDVLRERVLDALEAETGLGLTGLRGAISVEH
ncbi:MAG TPA: phytoene desaturase family protein, partial [Candidatus Dormibacteraeota bacterium]|nr:phytoene desaturase family protein [Candidatus Dormibacteraeota bacterium]